MIFCTRKCFYAQPLQWRHNGWDSVSNHQPRHCLLNRLFGRRSKKTSKLYGLCVRSSPGTGEFPAQMASNAEIVSIWWRHHAFMILYYPTRFHLVREDIFTTCFLHWILTCYSMQLKNAGACIWISSQRFTLKYIMNTYDGKLYLEPNLIHIFFKRFPSLIRACKAVCALKDCDTLLFHDILAWFWTMCLPIPNR